MKNCVDPQFTDGHSSLSIPQSFCYAKIQPPLGKGAGGGARGRGKERERVVRLEEEIQKEPTAGEVLQELRSVGLCRATDCLQIVNGKVELKPEALEGEKGAGILSLEYTEKGWKVKFCDKLKAVELLGDHLGLFREHTVRETENCNLLEAILDGTREELEVDDLSELQ